MSYSKLHSSIVNSSLWCEPDNVRLLFITLLAMCDKDGCVYGSRGGLERQACIACADDDCDPWDALLNPSKDSSDKRRAPENEGRRIEEIPGGFRLLNFDYYRGLRNDDDRRDQNRVAQAKFKAKVSHGKPKQAVVSQGKPPKAYTDTDTDTDTDTETDPDQGATTRAPSGPRRTKISVRNTAPHSDVVGGLQVMAAFDFFWDRYPKKVGKGAAKKAWDRLKPDEALARHILAALVWQIPSPQWMKDDGQFIPNPATYLHQERWMDEPPTPAGNPFGLSPKEEANRQACQRGLERILAHYDKDERDDPSQLPT